MKVFDSEQNTRWDSKINFVDDNNVLVGYDTAQSCCEHAGWMLSREYPTSLESEGFNSIDPEGYQFDPEYFSQEFNPSEIDDGGVAVFRLTKGNDQIFLTLFNIQNGYYGHGFSMTCGNETLHYGTI